ncbi:MAG: hypothetical protein HY747_04830 [Elusimicrobia bacterium]|nr:hypothetical protein [Elusimicrobiota bacterium]
MKKQGKRIVFNLGTIEVCEIGLQKWPSIAVGQQPRKAPSYFANLSRIVLVIFLIVGFTLGLSAEKNYAVEKSSWMEYYRSQLDYALVNEGKNLYQLDYKRLGYSDKSIDQRLPVITAYKIAYLADKYGDFQTVAKYYCKCRDLERKRPPECYSWGDSNSEDLCIGALERIGRCSEALKEWEKSFETYLFNFGGETREQQMSNLKKTMEEDREVKEFAKDFLSWGEKLEEKIKKKKCEPKQLDIDTKMHHWFYAEDRKKNLEALKYYRQHRVKFMLEKAAKEHKDKKVRKQAEK